jgi:hypothetical protein
MPLQKIQSIQQTFRPTIHIPKLFFYHFKRKTLKAFPEKALPTHNFPKRNLFQNDMKVFAEKSFISRKPH